MEVRGFFGHIPARDSFNIFRPATTYQCDRKGELTLLKLTITVPVAYLTCEQTFQAAEKGDKSRRNIFPSP